MSQALSHSLSRFHSWLGPIYLSHVTKGCIGPTLIWLSIATSGPAERELYKIGDFWTKNNSYSLWKGTSPLGVTVVLTSLISASYGITNFLRVGPLKVVPHQPASGFGHLSFFLIFLTSICSLFHLAVIYSYSQVHRHHERINILYVLQYRRW